MKLTVACGARSLSARRYATPDSLEEEPINSIRFAMVLSSVSFAAGLLGAPTIAFGQNCEALFREHLASDLDLPHLEFDQSMGMGWRALSDADCHEQAADLIEAYIAHNQVDHLIMRWHIAQLRAIDGDDKRAIEAARAVLLEEEDLEEQGLEGLRWNDYVLGTIAFLERNRGRLIHYRDRVEEGQEKHPGNRVHLGHLEVLIQHFEESYADAMRRF